MSMRVLPIITLIAVCSIVPARGQSLPSAPRDACLEDYRRLCSDVARGGGRIRKCMMDNAGQLSARCKAALGSRTKSN